ncbi:conserved hypothetical protein [Culex quinquefasciatus]|uniref:F-box domain-containing protein n=1 Tax=Culex quinquefasciatus TaxID=7176 RepID=B0WB10_CULQU|nr:conserved hypothetical protein [Culex quinquefasciatus]|eukprot:XP_001845894.1 conserved hypothetical protein [Culex quinquefasciatus]
MTLSENVCKICETQVTGSTTQVICGGTCCQSFHPFCVDLNRSSLNVLTSNEGLRWFCEDCRQHCEALEEAGVKHTIRDVMARLDEHGEILKRIGALLSLGKVNEEDHKLSAVNCLKTSMTEFEDCKENITAKNGESKEPKIRFEKIECTESALLKSHEQSKSNLKLSEQIMLNIFDHMSSEQLLQARLVCRHWKSLIEGSPSLSKRLFLKFYNGTLENQESGSKVALSLMKIATGGNKHHRAYHRPLRNIVLGTGEGAETISKSRNNQHRWIDRANERGFHAGLSNEQVEQSVS